MSWYTIRVYHAGTEVWAEKWHLRDRAHAVAHAKYLALAAAREAVHPSVFEPAQVYWAIDGVGSGQTGVQARDCTVAELNVSKGGA